jgi:hypothetical protein
MGGRNFQTLQDLCTVEFKIVGDITRGAAKKQFDYQMAKPVKE